VLSFIDREKISFKPIAYRDKEGSKITYEFINLSSCVNLEIDVVREDLINFKYSITSKIKLKLSKLIANYAIFLGAEPEFTWVPHLRPKENYVMGDHVFRSPAIIYKKGKYSFAFIPDIKLLAENRPFQTIMDLNLKSVKSTGYPNIYYGFGRYKPVEHILFRHNPKKKLKINANTELVLGYYIKIFNGSSIDDVLQEINSFLWENFGRELLYENCNPQVISYDKCVDEGFKAIVERHKVWGNFKINNNECGGFWHTSWLGRKKTRIRFVDPKKFSIEKQMKKNAQRLVTRETRLSRFIMYFTNRPFWLKLFDKVTRRFAIIQRHAEIMNNAWFLNIRSGYAFSFFGRLWKNEDLVDKGNRTLNTVLSLPRTRGIFPSMILPTSIDGSEYCTINGIKAFTYVDDFNTVDASLSMYWALKFHQDFEPNEDIKEKSNELFKLIEEIQLKNGAIPVFISFESNGKEPLIRDILINSASSGAPLMFLMEYYKVSKNKKIIPVAKEIAEYLQREIIPENKWHDFEPFFSCTHLPLDYYDNYTKSHVMNALCIYWCAEGFKELYKITQEKDYLKTGERVLSVLSLFQQVWNMPYISYNTFGGFSSQNADAELSDTRQALFLRVYMEYYLETGKKEYMERAIAALRACWAMQLVRELEDQCPGNLKGIKTVDGVDRGSVTENYGHSGYDFRVPGFMMLDWGVGSSASATAYVKKHFGDLFIDFKEKMAWGIDGLIVRKFDYIDKKIIIDYEKIPDKKYILVKARNPPDENSELIMNNVSIGLKGKKNFENGFII